MTDNETRVDFMIGDSDALILEILPGGDALEMEIGDDEEALALDVMQDVVVSEGFPVYTGETHVTPGPGSTVLETQYRTVMDRIVVDPIPKNYGLITYNGRTITVS